MKIRLFIIVVALVVLAPALARAQAITSYTLAISNGATASLPVGAGGFVCGVTPKTLATGPSINPTRAIIDDPANPTGADCVYTDPGTGILRSLPFGAVSYTATIAAVNSAGTSTLTASLFPFSRPGGVPTAPQGLRLVQSSWRGFQRPHYRLG